MTTFLCDCSSCTSPDRCRAVVVVVVVSVDVELAVPVPAATAAVNEETDGGLVVDGGDSALTTIPRRQRRR